MAKILHISKYYYPFFGGIEDVAQTIVEELKPFHTQKIICFNNHNRTIEEIIDGVSVTRIATIGKFFSQPVSTIYLLHLKRIIAEFQPDYIHFHLPNPLVTLCLLKVDLSKIKLYIHWHADILGQSLIYRIYKKYERKILFLSDKIIATSQIYLENSVPLKNFLYKTIIIPNTINENKFLSVEEEEQKIEKIRQKFDNKKILFFVGRHVRYKGIEHLIEIEKLVKDDCVFVIAGQGELTSRLKKRAKNSRIHFVGWLSNEDLMLYMKASSVFVFPSINRSEAFGVALAEALYCGLPAVCFDIVGSGVTWVNKHNFSGLVVENHNVSEFAKAVSKLLQNNALQETMSKNASIRIKENFLKEKAFVVLHEIYQEKHYSQELKTNVSIVLYNNDFEKVKSLVQSLRETSKIAKIYLIDNSKKINEGYKKLDVIYIFNNKNMGYGRAHNLALRQTLCNKDASNRLVMNADISLKSSVIDSMLTFMQQNSDIGALMPKVFYPNGKIQYLCRLLPSPVDLIGRRFLPKKFMRKRVEQVEMRQTDYNHIINVPHISGCFMFFKAEVLEKSGLFDSRYFLYLEDVDLTRRIGKEARTVFYPKVSIIHEHRRGSYNNARLLLRHISSAFKYFDKWGWFSDRERNIINEQTLKQIKRV